MVLKQTGRKPISTVKEKSQRKHVASTSRGDKTGMDNKVITARTSPLSRAMERKPFKLEIVIEAYLVLNCGPQSELRPQDCRCGPYRNRIRPQLRCESNTLKKPQRRKIEEKFTPQRPQYESQQPQWPHPRRPQPQPHPRPQPQFKTIRLS